MAKTPKCPYCGAEMKVGGCDNCFWCICPECDSTAPVGYSRADALAKALHLAETLRAEWYVYDDEHDECSNCNYLHAKKDKEVDKNEKP